MAAQHQQQAQIQPAIDYVLRQLSPENLNLTNFRTATAPLTTIGTLEEPVLRDLVDKLAKCATSLALKLSNAEQNVSGDLFKAVFTLASSLLQKTTEPGSDPILATYEKLSSAAGDITTTCRMTPSLGHVNAHIHEAHQAARKVLKAPSLPKAP